MINISENLTPQQIVDKLDQHIIGQNQAKRSMAIAIRNRYRRQKLDQRLKEEINPKNIMMIGPTGVGKTEIARRLSKLIKAPFVKIEATKFTEVGYVGRNVESMVKDLVAESIHLVEQEKHEQVSQQARRQAETRLVDLLVSEQASKNAHDSNDSEVYATDDIRTRRREIKDKLAKGLLEDEYVTVKLDKDPGNDDNLMGEQFEEMGVNFKELFGKILPKESEHKKMIVKDAREELARQEADKLINKDQINREAIERAENYGIIFLDEFDKIAVSDNRSGGQDVSREGVQRDILPIVEGSTVNTKFGRVNTDRVMFIGAGAFHDSKPSDLIPELQGRFPIRVELNSLSREDFYRILVEPSNALLDQYKALLQTEQVEVDFTEDAVVELAYMCEFVNENTEDIGARRLHTILEKLLEELSFYAPEMAGQRIEINANYVKDQLQDIITKKDSSRFIL